MFGRLWPTARWISPSPCRKPSEVSRTLEPVEWSGWSGTRVASLRCFFWEGFKTVWLRCHSEVEDSFCLGGFWGWVWGAFWLRFYLKGYFCACFQWFCVKRVRLNGNGSKAGWKEQHNTSLTETHCVSSPEASWNEREKPNHPYIAKLNQHLLVGKAKALKNKHRKTEIIKST